MTTTGRSCSITGQQLSVHAARAIYGRLTDRFGGRPPTPAEILADDPEQLRAAAGLSRAKVGFLRSLAEHVISGELELERLDELDDEQVIAELVAVKGLGVWTAHMFLMFHPRAPGRPGRRRPRHPAGDRTRLRPSRGALGGGHGGDRGAVAPPPHARLPLPVALAGERAGLIAPRAAGLTAGQGPRSLPDRGRRPEGLLLLLRRPEGLLLLLLLLRALLALRLRAVFLRAAFSHAWRLLFFLSFLHSFSALASFWALLSTA